jgi:uncharacterized protein YqjF (DUF2071 family)
MIAKDAYTERDMATKTFLTAEWRKLIMAQYCVEPQTLANYLPNGLELDLYEGRCIVSLVGFLFDRTRLKGVAIPLHTRFEEVNLRFYVRRRDVDGISRRGVVFVREFVPRAAITFVATTFYEEPYATLPMRHTVSESGSGLRVEYAWKHRGSWSSVAVDAETTPVAIEAGSLEEFITEHYWGFTKRSDGFTSQYEVKHPRWMVYPVLKCAVDADFGALYGERFAGLNGIAPESVLLAEGSAVSVDSGSRLALG